MHPLLRITRLAARRARLATVLPLGLSVRLYGDTDKWVHGYTQHYSHVMRRHRYRHLGIIEIGVGGKESSQPGGSLRVWRDYFPRAVIVGMDIHSKSIDLGPRVRFVQGDQSSASDLHRAYDALHGTPLTLVIDDGSHVAAHARASFEVLFPRMASGGLYIVEDLSTSYWEAWGGSIPASEETAVGLARTLVDDVQFHDSTFTRNPDWGPRPASIISPDVAELHVFPGMFVCVRR